MAEDGEVVLCEVGIDANGATVGVGCPCGELGRVSVWDGGCMVRTTLAARAVISRSEETWLRVSLSAARSAGERREISRRHSTARARRIASVTRRELCWCEVEGTKKSLRCAHARARALPASVFADSDRACFSSSAPSLWIFPGLFVA